jgi:hypothetical protein
MKRPIADRPAEVFGYFIGDGTDSAVDARQRHWCPFQGRVCTKTSRLLDIPFGVCSVQSGTAVYSVCSQRFEEPGRFTKTPFVLEDIALHYFGDLDNITTFAGVPLSGFGSIDYVLARHKLMSSAIDDFVTVEFRSDSTTAAGALVRAMSDFMAGQDLTSRSYRFGMNTYDTIKRSVTQLFNKGIVYEAWGVKSYWVMQDYIYDNLAARYGLKLSGYDPSDATRFALYDLEPKEDRLTLKRKRIISVSVDEVYQAMRKNPGAPDKDDFVTSLKRRLEAKLKLQVT